MIELPEAITLAKQINDTFVGKTVKSVLPPTKAHKFCWFEGSPFDYDSILGSHTVTSSSAFGIFAEICFDGGRYLCFDDGVNARLVTEDNVPDNYQLKIDFTDGTSLVFTVAMYGGIALHDNSYNNEYYLKSKNYTSPFSPDFPLLFHDNFEKCKTLGAKAFLATKQRFPGIGNGVLQDILFYAGIHPKQKLSASDGDAEEKLLSSLINVLEKMTDLGGRDTEKDIFGNPGGYRTIMSKLHAEEGCPRCGGAIFKESYLGGTVYFCPSCQQLHK